MPPPPGTTPATGTTPVASTTPATGAGCPDPRVPDDLEKSLPVAPCQTCEDFCAAETKARNEACDLLRTRVALYLDTRGCPSELESAGDCGCTTCDTVASTGCSTCGLTSSSVIPSVPVSTPVSTGCSTCGLASYAVPSMPTSYYPSYPSYPSYSSSYLVDNTDTSLQTPQEAIDEARTEQFYGQTGGLGLDDSQNWETNGVMLGDDATSAIGGDVMGADVAAAAAISESVNAINDMTAVEDGVIAQADAVLANYDAMIQSEIDQIAAIEATSRPNLDPRGDYRSEERVDRRRERVGVPYGLASTPGLRASTDYFDQRRQQRQDELRRELAGLDTQMGGTGGEVIPLFQQY